MKKDVAIYIAVLAVALALQYTVELYWGATLALSARPLVPWVIDAVSYGVLGGVAWIVLRSRPVPVRIVFLVLIAVIPHVLFEITHGSDPAYPYIGLLFIVPDLIWVSLGAGIASVLVPKLSAKKTLP